MGVEMQREKNETFIGRQTFMRRFHSPLAAVDDELLYAIEERR